MIFDLRIYTLHNNKFADWLKLYEQYGHPEALRRACAVRDHRGRPAQPGRARLEVRDRPTARPSATR
jgi:hypothetical protein